jgi:hypothetical protein
MGKFSARFRIEVEPNGPIVENALAKSSQSINKGTFQVNGKVLSKKNL